MAINTQKKAPKTEPFLTRLPADVFNQLKPLKTQGQYKSRNAAVVDSLRRNIKRVVKT